jgi:hypothetical protein
MKKSCFLAPVLCFLLWSGCATVNTPPPPLSPQEISRIDYGQPPENYEKVIKDYFAQTLFEPDAARYRFGKPVAGYMQDGRLMGGKLRDAGYVVEIWITVKNRSGGFLPEAHLGILIKNGEVRLELSESELSEVKRAP